MIEPNQAEITKTKSGLALTPVVELTKALHTAFKPQDVWGDEPDTQKGLDEIGPVEAAAAIANAVYHATGKRITELPISLEKLL